MLTLFLLAITPLSVISTLVLPSTAPRGFNSFDLQVYNRKHVGPGWNESVYRATAKALVSQGLLARGYDTIVIDGGWSDHADKYGRSLPNERLWPSSAGGKGFAPLAAWTHSLGLKMGVWHIRGVIDTTVALKTPVKGTSSTIDQLVWDPAHCPAGQEHWCVCTWAKQYIGIDATHPDAQAYYNSQVDLYAEWGLDFLKWDCLYDNTQGYSDEEALVVNAVRQSSRELVLSLSPGGGMAKDDAQWVAEGQRASMYRITGDFHAAPAWPGAQTRFGLAEHAFAVANMTSLIGQRRTWPDLDMMDLGVDSPWHHTPTARLHAALWMMARAPLMFAGKLPASPETLNLVANPLALDIHAFSSSLTATYQGDCSCKPVPYQNEFACQPYNLPGRPPCVAVWVSRMPNPGCRALAVLVLGNSSATVTIPWRDLGVAAGHTVNVTNIYDGTSQPSTGIGLRLHVAAQGGELMMLAPHAAEECTRKE